MRTRKPETRLRLRLVPSKVRLVMIRNTQQAIVSVWRFPELGPKVLDQPDEQGIECQVIDDLGGL